MLILGIKVSLYELILDIELYERLFHHLNSEFDEIIDDYKNNKNNKMNYKNFITTLN